MGTNASKEPIWHSTSFDLPLSDENLTYIRNRSDPILGDLEELVHKDNNDSLLKKEVLLNDKSELTDEVLTKLKARVHLNSENLLKIYGFVLNLSSEETSKIGIFFEPFSGSAGVVFADREKEKNPFDDEELYTSLIAVVQILAYLQSHKISHGYLTPQSILMSKEGEIKLLDHSLIQKENSAFNACSEGAQIPYIAPELVNLLREKAAVTNEVNQFKVDMFSLGLTFLYGALLEEPTDCYDWEALTFNESALAERLSKVQAKYPGRFSNILSHVLKIDVADRPDAVALLTRLTYYESSSSQKVNRAAYQVNGAAYQANGTYSSSQYTFVDPRVQEIIREAKEKNWIKNASQTQTSPLYYTQQLATDEHKTSILTTSELFTRTPIIKHENDYLSKYHSPFLERYNNYLSQTQFIEKSYSAENGYSTERDINRIDTGRLIFNRPEVNEIIENVIGLKKSTITIQKSPSPVKNELVISTIPESNIEASIKESNIRRSVISEERVINELPFTQRSFVNVSSFESPEKKSYRQIVRESDGYSWGSGVKTPLETVVNVVNVSTAYSPRRVQTKEEIIKELRSKFGNQKAQESAEKVIEKIQESKAESIVTSKFQESVIESKSEVIADSKTEVKQDAKAKGKAGKKK